jgi:hypothetical protein
VCSLFVHDRQLALPRFLTRQPGGQPSREDLGQAATDYVSLGAVVTTRQLTQHGLLLLRDADLLSYHLGSHHDHLSK